ncbi:MAG: MBL fold metallo-hydrolase [Acidobacteriota bacterium]|nr:MBL fold metallo-hydrolase [Acidobacteriota bacterium]
MTDITSSAGSRGTGRRGRVPWTLAALAALSWMPWAKAYAQRAPSGANEIEALEIRPNFFMIAGAGGNIGVQLGELGVVLVDTGSAQMTDQVLAAIRKISSRPIRFIVNTSAEPDHVGGNEKLSKAGVSLIPANNAGGVNVVNEVDKSGAAGILATDNVLNRMSAPTGQVSPFPTAAWPTETFSEDEKDTYLNGEGIQVLAQPAAHSDGDAMVFFRRSDVVVAGEVLDMNRFPVIDVEKGGSIQGEISALNRLIDITIPETPLVWQEGGTLVIPGRGRICDEADVVEYRDMLTIIGDVVQDMIQKGMTLSQIKASDPTKEYRPRYGAESGPWTTDMFIEAVYRSLSAKK